MKHFRFLIENRPLTIFTDHKPITHAISRISPALNARQDRQLAYISEFSTDIRHINGAENIVSDLLSRSAVARSISTQTSAMVPELELIEVNAVDGLDFAVIADAQENCPEGRYFSDKKDEKGEIGLIICQKTIFLIYQTYTEISLNV